jgi:putative membrane-bound dehydrogenase-like protein
MRILVPSLCLLLSAITAAAEPAKIVFISHKTSHGRGAHEYAAGAEVIGHWLKGHYGDKVETVYHIGWPEDPEAAFGGAATVVFSCTGGGNHLVMNRVPEFDQVMRRGVGLACLHYAVEVPIGPAGKGMLAWMGGYFETNWSVNPHWTPSFEVFPEHPAAGGLEPFSVNDEWYFHMRFVENEEGVTPILTAPAPAETMARGDGAHSGNPAVREAVAAGKKQHVAWTYQRGEDYGNGRGFGFTGLHYHWNLEDDHFRKTVLNGVAWSAGLEVPEVGIDSPRPSRAYLEASIDAVMADKPVLSPKEFVAATEKQAGAVGEALFTSEVIRPTTEGHGVDIDVELPEGAKQLALVVGDAGDGYSFDWANWGDARLVVGEQEIALSGLEWAYASAGWRSVQVGKNADGGVMRSAGQAIEDGIGTHANSLVLYDLPEGAARFRARACLDEGGLSQGGGAAASVRFAVHAGEALPRDAGAYPVVGPGAVAGAGGVQGDLRDPANAVASLDLREGLEATLFASEPMLLSPSAIDIDHLGRVWVCEVVNYRRHQGKRSEGDRILILEDSTGDGKADQVTVFYQGTDVDSAHGICVLGNRVIVSAGEDIFYLIDDDGDGKADRKELLFTKMGNAQHDHNAHAFHFGPDGKLYFNIGNVWKQLCDAEGEIVVDLAGNEVKPERKPYQEGIILRCDLDGSNVEVLGWNFRNNWEVAVDSFGRLWQSDNDDDGNRAVRINYVYEFGNYGFRDEITGAGWREPRIGMEESIPEQHWHLNDPGVVPNLLLTGAGSPTGIVVYEGSLLPEIFHGQPIHGEPGANVVRAYLSTPEGAGFVAKIEDIASSERDRWFRPSDVCVAPDGSLVIADWYDPGVGGHGMGDLERGRIFVVAPEGHRYGEGARDYNFDIVDGALAALRSPNEAARFLAYESLQFFGERARSGLEAIYSRESGEKAEYRARAMWLLVRLDPLSYLGGGGERDALADPDPRLRVAGVKAARQLAEDEGQLLDWLSPRADDPDAQVRAEVGVALRFIGGERADALWARLAQGHDGEDRWYLEALGIGADLHWEGRLAALGDEISTPLLWRSRAAASAGLIAERLVSGEAEGWEERLLRAFHFQAAGEDRQLALRRAFDEGEVGVASLVAVHLLDRGALGDEAARARLAKLADAAKGTGLMVSLVSRQGLEGYEEELIAFAVAEGGGDVAVGAVRHLLADGGRDTLAKWLGKVGEAGEAGDAGVVASLLGQVNDGRAFEILAGIVRGGDSPGELRRAAVAALSASKDGGNALLDLAEGGQLPTEVRFTAAALLSRHGDGGVRERAGKVLDMPPAPGVESLPPVGQLLEMKGDVGRGKEAYVKATCITCHQVDGEGLNFGPDLSGIGGKLPPEGLYEAILYPSHSVAHGYQGVSIEKKDGALLAGFISSETADSITLRMAGGLEEVVKVSDIAERKELAESLMPAGLQALLAVEELADLVAYLASLRGGE